MVGNKRNTQSVMVDAISLEAEILSNLQRLERDGEEETHREVTKFVESRQSTAAVLRALLSIEQRLGRFEELVNTFHAVAKPQVIDKQWFTVREVAELLGKAEFTVREWCRLGRIHASKRACGRGNTQEWIISDTEITRIQNEGLLPM